MRDFETIRSLVGQDLKEEELKYVDCYVHDPLGLFIPSIGTCGYAQRENHCHPSYMVTVLFSRSEKELGIKRNRYTAAILSPGIPHSDLPEEWRYYCILIDKDYFEQQYFLYTGETPYFENKQFTLCSDILKTLNTFAFEYSKNMQHAEITLSAQVTLITHWIIRSILGENMDMRSVSSHYEVGRIQQYIEQNFDRSITVGDLAQLAHLSESGLNRLFKKETGLTPLEYVIETRIEKSKMLLRRKDIPVTEIAMRCGFGSNAHFTSCFKRLAHVSPSEYRQAYRE